MSVEFSDLYIDELSSIKAPPPREPFRKRDLSGMFTTLLGLPERALFLSTSALCSGTVEVPLDSDQGEY